MTTDAIVYQVYGLHGPTVYKGTHADYARLCQRCWDMCRNAGPYTIHYLPTGERLVCFDRNDDGTPRKQSFGIPCVQSVEEALAK